MNGTATMEPDRPFPKRGYGGRSNQFRPPITQIQPHNSPEKVTTRNPRHTNWVSEYMNTTIIPNNTLFTPML